MFGIGDSISLALNLLATPSPAAAQDVPPDFDWRGGEARNIPLRGLTGQVSISDPLYDWSNTGSHSAGVSTPASAYSYMSDGRVSTPSGYACVPDPGLGVQFRPITPLAPTLYTPTPRAPTSLEFPRPSSSTSTPMSYVTARSTPSSSNSTPYTTASLISPSSASTPYARSMSSSSTPTSSAQFSPIVPVNPPAYERSHPPSSILGRPTGLFPSYPAHETNASDISNRGPVTYDFSPRTETPAWDKARPLFRPETPLSIVETTRELDHHPSSRAIQKRKASPAPNNSPPKQQRRVEPEVIKVESDSEDGEYEGMELYDTGYQSVDDKANVKPKPLSKAVVSRQIKGRGKKSSPKNRAIIEDDEDKEEDAADGDAADDEYTIEDPVKVKKESVKEEPVEKKRVKPTPKYVPVGTKWKGPRGGGIKFNAKVPRPEGWVDGVYRWSYSTGGPVSTAIGDRMPGDIHFCHSTKSYADEDEPFTTWVARDDSKGLRWVEYTPGQPHPRFKGWVLQEAMLPKTPPRWVKEATFKAKY